MDTIRELKNIPEIAGAALAWIIFAVIATALQILAIAVDAIAVAINSSLHVAYGATQQIQVCS